MKTLFDIECWLKKSRERALHFSIDVDGKINVEVDAETGSAHGDSKTLAQALENAMFDLREMENERAAFDAEQRTPTIPRHPQGTP